MFIGFHLLPDANKEKAKASSGFMNNEQFEKSASAIDVIVIDSSDDDDDDDVVEVDENVDNNHNVEKEVKPDECL